MKRIKKYSLPLLLSPLLCLASCNKMLCKSPFSKLSNVEKIELSAICQPELGLIELTPENDKYDSLLKELNSIQYYNQKRACKCGENEIIRVCFLDGSSFTYGGYYYNEFDKAGKQKGNTKRISVSSYNKFREIFHIYYTCNDSDYHYESDNSLNSLFDSSTFSIFQ